MCGRPIVLLGDLARNKYTITFTHAPTFFFACFRRFSFFLTSMVSHMTMLESLAPSRTTHSITWHDMLNIIKYMLWGLRKGESAKKWTDYTETDTCMRNYQISSSCLIYHHLPWQRYISSQGHNEELCLYNACHV